MGNWYIGITAIACAWHLRATAFTSGRRFLTLFLGPVPGGSILFGVLVISAKDSLSPDCGSGADIAGVGVVFYMALGILALGAVVMAVVRVAMPAFRSETLNEASHGATTTVR